MGIAMTATPTPPAPSRTRPQAVAKHAIQGFAASVFCVIFSVVNFFVWEQPANVLLGTIFLLISAVFFAMSFGVYAGQRWALVLSGFSSSLWAQSPEVKAFFEVPSTMPPALSQIAPPNSAPALIVGTLSSALMCPTCGGSLMYLQDLNRWYCPNEKRVILDTNQPQNA
jgi:hypothetical protein